MLVQTTDFIDVAARARELGCRVPVGIALLPGNYSTAASASEFCFHAATAHVRSAWQDAGLEDEGPGPDAGIGDSGLGTSLEIPTPAPSASVNVPLAVFFGTALSDGSAWRVAIALGMVSSVLASDSRCVSPRDVQLDVVVERPGDHGYACIEYQGDAYGIVALAREVRRVWTGK
jgi:hypothetical protein